MHTPITKAIFPVAGLGTRFLPATKANPKEMLPIIDKPIIQYAVEEALAAGVTELIFVTSSNKRAIEDHFDSHFELETLLEKKAEYQKLQLIRQTLPNHVKCVYVRQKAPLGLGHAVLCAEHLINNEPFIVVLADDLLATQPQNCLATMIAAYQQQPHSMIAVQPIEAADTRSYGIIKPYPTTDEALMRLAAIIEKPEPANAPSNLAVIGRYVFTYTIFKCLHATGLGSGGEMQLTDAIAKLIQHESVYARVCPNKRYDCGSKIGYMEAMLAYGLQHPELKAQFKALLQRYSQ